MLLQKDDKLWYIYGKGLLSQVNNIVAMFTTIQKVGISYLKLIN